MASAPRKKPAYDPDKLTHAALAHHLALEERSIRELFDKGVFPDEVDRKAMTIRDLDVCRVAYIKHLRDRASGRVKEVEEVDEDDDPNIQLARLRKEQWKGQIIKNRKADGLVIERSVVLLAVSAAFSRVRSQLLKLPKVLAKKLLRKTDEVEIREILTDAIHFALNELAQTPVESIGSDQSETEDDDSEDDQA